MKEPLRSTAGRCTGVPRLSASKTKRPKWPILAALFRGHFLAGKVTAIDMEPVFNYSFPLIRNT